VVALADPPRILALAVTDDAALGEDQRPLVSRQPAQRVADHRLGMAVAIDGGRVDPIDPEIDRMGDGRNRLGIVLRPPHVPAHRPRPDPQPRDVEPGCAKGAGGQMRGHGHGRLLLVRGG
jgi:hypothetical protein